MFALRDTQTAFASTLRHGPDQCPDGLFTGSRNRALLGLKVHANTISHARLVALEETFPHTRAAMGEAEFNAVSRDWLDAGHRCDTPLALIGETFPDWLANNQRHPGLDPGSIVEPSPHAFGEAQSLAPDQVRGDEVGDTARTVQTGFATLARFEWLWLQAYHAAEARPLSREVMHEIPPDILLTWTIAPHPAARLCACDDRMAAILGLSETPTHILNARPDAEVLVHPICEANANLFAIFDGRKNLSEVLETFWAAWPNEDAVAGINHVVALGALTMETAS